jgi:hypothetical protein
MVLMVSLRIRVLKDKTLVEAASLKILVSFGSLDEHHGSGKSDYHTSWQRNAGNRKRN